MRGQPRTRARAIPPAWVRCPDPADVVQVVDEQQPQSNPPDDPIDLGAKLRGRLAPSGWMAEGCAKSGQQLGNARAIRSLDECDRDARLRSLRDLGREHAGEKAACDGGLPLLLVPTISRLSGRARRSARSSRSRPSNASRARPYPILSVAVDLRDPRRVAQPQGRDGHPRRGGPPRSPSERSSDLRRHQTPGSPAGQ